MQIKIPKFQLAHRGSGNGVSNANSFYPPLYTGHVSKLLTFIPLAVGAALVPLQFQETFDSLRIAGSPLRGGVHRPARHFESSYMSMDFKSGELRIVKEPKVVVVDLGLTLKRVASLLVVESCQVDAQGTVTRYWLALPLPPRSWNLAAVKLTRLPNVGRWELAKRSSGVALWLKEYSPMPLK